MNPRKKTKLILGLGILSLVLVFILSCSMLSKAKNKNLTLNGTIEIDDIMVGSKIGGRVTEILVKEGDQIKKGDILVRLDNSQLQAVKDQNKAAINLAEQNIAQKNAYLSLVRSGNRNQEVLRAKSDLDGIKAKLDLANKDEDRYAKLYKEGAISQQQYDSSKNQVDVLKTQVKSAQETYDLVKTGFRKEDITQAQANLDSAKANLKQAQHALEETETQFKEMVITAPMDATVEVSNLRPGDLLSPNQSAMTLVIPDKLWVRVYAPENYLGYLKENAKVNVKVDSFENETFPGYVEQINRKAEFTPRNIQTIEERINTVFGVKIRLDNSSGKLRAGMSADVTFPDIPTK